MDTSFSVSITVDEAPPDEGPEGCKVLAHKVPINLYISDEIVIYYLQLIINTI